MAINPPSDLVLDVAQAVDPLEYRASVEKLKNMQTAVPATKADASAPQFAELAVSNGASDMHFSAVKTVDKRPAEAYRKFEAFMLQTFIQDMFTTDTPSVFGKGQSGEYWKSMMAEMMAKEMAEGDGIGVAKMLEARQKLADAQSAIDSQAAANSIVQRAEIAMVRRHLDKSE